MKRFATLLAILAWGNTQSINIHKLEENPGMLPVQLGTASNVDSYWTLIRIIDVVPLRLEFNNLVNNFKNITSAYYKHSNGPGYLREVENFQKLLENTIKTIEQKFNAIDPLNVKRQRRAFFNGLGSFIKIITGNLDNDDAERYNKAIQDLTNAQNNQKLLMKEQIKLTTFAIEKFNSTIIKLASNQLMFQEKIAYMELFINATNVWKSKSEHRLTFVSVYLQLITSLDTIKDILETLEETLTFAKLNVMHPSILSPDDLMEELLEIEPSLNEATFPLPLRRENYPEFQKLIQIKAFTQLSKIHLILEIPIIKTIKYNYFHLYSCPIRKNSIYTVIIPQTKYLLINEHDYVLSNQKCIELQPTNFICDYEINQINENSPCEIQLIQFTKNYDNCQQHHLDIKATKIQYLSSNQWLLVTKDEEIVKQECNSRNVSTALNGTYIISMDGNCKMEVHSKLVRSQKGRVKINTIKIPNLSFEIHPTESQVKFKPMEMEPINLDELKATDLRLHQIKMEIEETPKSIYFNRSSAWTILIYMLIIISTICYVSVKIFQRKKSASPIEQNIDQIGLQNLRQP